MRKLFKGECGCKRCFEIRDELDKLKKELQIHLCTYCGTPLNEHEKQTMHGCTIKN